jgi:hypothetical protein
MAAPDVVEAFGLEAANELAALAIDIGCAAPERITTATTKVSARMMGELRDALDRAGVDWRKLVRARLAAELERKTRIHGTPGNPPSGGRAQL